MIEPSFAAVRCANCRKVIGRMAFGIFEYECCGVSVTVGREKRAGQIIVLKVDMRRRKLEQSTLV